MKKHHKFTIEVKDLKVRQPYAPLQKSFKNKKTYCRRAFKNWN